LTRPIRKECAELPAFSGIIRAVRDDTQRSGLERIRHELIVALSAITSVRNIDSFGSIATGCADQWSDLDLLVSCAVPEVTAWLAAAAIRSTKHVAFYRMFTGVSQPSGRYWFSNESPFHRLDVTFHSPAEHAAACRSGVRSGHPIHIRPEYVARLPADLTADTRLNSAAGRVEVTPRETETGRLLYLHLETAKDQLRGRPAKRNILETRRISGRRLEDTDGGWGQRPARLRRARRRIHPENFKLTHYRGVQSVCARTSDKLKFVGLEFGHFHGQAAA
jgi:hypothetical protein